MIGKLQPDRTLYIASFTPRSAIGVIHAAGADGFTVSGRFNALNDNVILEWNRDNDFEHPDVRYLPDGDFRGLTLSYDMDHSGLADIATELYAYTGFPCLTIYAGTPEQRYQVPLKNYAAPVAGDAHLPAAASLTLSGTLAAGDRAGVLFLSEAYWRTAAENQTPADLVAGLADDINASATMQASATGAVLTLTTRRLGDDANLIRGYTLATGGAQWSAATFRCLGGHSPSWHIAIPFDSLTNVPAGEIRKMQWVFSPPLPDSGAFIRTPFQAAFRNWQLTGTGATQLTRGCPRQRWEADSSAVRLSGAWSKVAGQFSQGFYMAAAAAGAYAELSYSFPLQHDLYAGVWRDTFGGLAQVTVDGSPAAPLDCYSGLYGTYRARVRLAGNLAPGPHTVRVTASGTHTTGSQGWNVNLDFFEALVAADWAAPEVLAADLSPATDFDTAHALALSPQRLAWGIQQLGLCGEVNHFVGIGQFAERRRDGGIFPQRVYTFSGEPAPNDTVILHFGDSSIGHYLQTGDTIASTIQALGFKINALFTGVWAAGSGNQLTVTVRVPSYSLTASEEVETAGTLAVSAEGELTGGVEGEWLVDPAIAPRLNPAAQCWHREFASELAARGIGVIFTYSAELTGAPSDFAQRYPDASPVITSNASVQTAFRPESTGYWKDVYRETAELMAAAGVTPALQFGEVQWWYFPNASGMPYYDAYTAAEFQSRFNRALPVIAGGNEDPASWPDESSFLRGQLQAHVDAIQAYVRAAYPSTRFEVLWPMDVNDPATQRFNFAVNLPDNWTPASFDTFCSEAFGYTSLEHDMAKAVAALRFPMDARGFPPARSRHIVGLFGYPWPWERAVLHARRAGLSVINLWAYDQICFFDLEVPPIGESRRAFFVG